VLDQSRIYSTNTFERLNDKSRDNERELAVDQNKYSLIKKGNLNPHTISITDVASQEND